jgi:hypothetical protein
VRNETTNLRKDAMAATLVEGLAMRWRMNIMARL